MESYVGKVSSAGQLTLPKKVRRELGLEGVEYVEVSVVGKAAVIRRLRENEAVLAEIRRRVRKSGMTRERVRVLVREARGRTWKKRYREVLP